MGSMFLLRFAAFLARLEPCIRARLHDDLPLRVDCLDDGGCLAHAGAS
jgi:hypothetical protein